MICQVNSIIFFNYFKRDPLDLYKYGVSGPWVLSRLNDEKAMGNGRLAIGDRRWAIGNGPGTIGVKRRA